MKRFLLLALIVGLFSPIAANAQRDEVRHICASYDVGELTAKQALRKLGLTVLKNNNMPKVSMYCGSYKGK